MDKQTEQARNRLHRLLTVVNIPKSLADAHNEMGRLSDEIERLREGLRSITCEPINAEYMAQNILDGLPPYHGTMLECTENCNCKVGAGGTALEVHGTVFFKDNHQYRSQLRFPIADGAYELVKIENPDMTHPLFHVAGESFECSPDAEGEAHNAEVSGAGTASAGLPGWQANGETE